MRNFLSKALDPKAIVEGVREFIRSAFLSLLANLLLSFQAWEATGHFVIIPATLFLGAAYAGLRAVDKYIHETEFKAKGISPV